MLKTQKAERGSYTIEAVIVMSSILFAVCAILFSFMIMYQNVVLIYAASSGAEQGAATWVNSGIKMETGEGYNDDGLYWRLTEFGGGGSLAAQKKDKIKAYVMQKLSLSIFSNSKIDVNVDFSDNLIQRTVTVGVSQSITIPFEAVAKYFNNGDSPFVIKAEVSSAIAEPAEYIRNIDFVLDLCKKGGDIFSKVENAVKGLL